MVISIFILGLLLAIVSFSLFDDLIEHQYDNYRSQWELDGKPRGFGFNPSGSSYLSMCVLTSRLHKEIPEWALNDYEAQKKFKRYSIVNGACK
ncbi:MAG: hypothetical protein ACMZ64_09485 [Oleiphilus sp.]